MFGNKNDISNISSADWASKYLNYFDINDVENNLTSLGKLSNYDNQNWQIEFKVNVNSSKQNRFFK